MNVTTLKAFAQVKNLNQSDLARLCGVSRQRVSQWFKATHPETVNIGSQKLKDLAEALGIPADILLYPLPLIDDAAQLSKETTRLLWDRLYPDVVSLFVDAINESMIAIGRVIEVYGLYQSSQILGNRVWKQFPKCIKYIHPARRKVLESVWQIHENQMKN